jgi:hypothetical protein
VHTVVEFFVDAVGYSFEFGFLAAAFFLYGAIFTGAFAAQTTTQRKTSLTARKDEHF